MTYICSSQKIFKKMKIRSYKPSKLVEKFDLNFGSTAKYVQIYNSAKRVFWIFASVGKFNEQN